MKTILKSFLLLAISFNCFGQAPSFQWAQVLDSTTFALPTEAVLDNSGNYYITYIFLDSIDLGVVPNTNVHYDYRPSQYTYERVFAKYDAAGNYKWSKQLDSSAVGKVLATFSNGDVLLGGSFEGVADFDMGPSVSNLNSINGTEFIVRLDSNGNFIWAKQYGSSGAQLIYKGYIDLVDQIYLIGSFQGNGDFDPGPATVPMANVNNPTTVGGSLIMKLQSNGNLIWAKHFEGASHAHDICLGQNQEIYLSGQLTYQSDFDTGPGTILKSNYTVSNAFGGGAPYFCKLDSNGNLLWVNNFCTYTLDNYPHKIVLDQNENVYILGNYNDTVDFDPSIGVATLTAQPISSNNLLNDIYFAKFDKNGNFNWVKHLPSLNLAGAGGFTGSMGIDDQQNIYINGAGFNTIDFDPSAAIDTLTGVSYIAKYDTNGNYKWALTFDGLLGTINILNEDEILTTGHLAPGVADLDPGIGLFNAYCGVNNIVPFALKLKNNNVGLNENYSKPTDITVYPNPSNGTFIILSKEKVLSVNCYDLQGKIIPIDFTNDVINLYNLPLGIYFIKVMTTKGIHTEKIQLL